MLQKTVLLNGLVEPFLLDKMELDHYNVIQVSPSNLYTWNRLDLAFKKIYLELKDLNNSFATGIYRHDIRSQTLGKYHEFGNAD